MTALGFLAATIFGTSLPAAQGVSFSMAGNDVPAEFKSAPAREVSGFVEGDWTLPVVEGKFGVPVLNLSSAEILRRQPGEKATPFRVKVFILRRVERLEIDAKQVVNPVSLWMEDSHVAAAESALARAFASFQALHPLRVVPSVEITGDLGSQAAGYAEARVNRAEFDAEDGVYRGPFNATLVVGPSEDVAPGEALALGPDLASNALAKLEAALAGEELTAKHGAMPELPSDLRGRILCRRAGDIQVLGVDLEVARFVAPRLDAPVPLGVGGGRAYYATKVYGTAGDDLSFLTGKPEKREVPGYAEPAALGIAAPSAGDRAKAEVLASLTAPTKELGDLLIAPNPYLQVNACRVFQRLKDPVAMTLLQGALLSPSLLVAGEAVRAIAYQGGESADGALANVARSCPDDRSRILAAEAIAKPGDNRQNSVLATLLTCVTEAGRAQGVEVLGKVGTKESDTIALAFLRDVSPQVRLAVAKMVKPSEELIAKGLLWSAVNDPSEAVRSACLARLLGCPFPEIAADALRAWKGEVAPVRIHVLDQVQDLALARSALADSTPEVRAAAWRAVARLEPNLVESGLTLKEGEQDPLVLRTVASLNRRLPARIEEILAKSPDLAVKVLLKLRTGTN